jgi:hypothetical protein
MRRFLLAAASAISFAVMAPTAHAAITIDFSEYGSGTNYSDLITKEGFWFTNNSGFRTPIPLADADPVNTAVANRLPGDYTLVSRYAGGTFDLISMDLGDRLNIGAGGSVDFFFSNGDTVSRLVDFSSGLNTVTFNESGIEWFAFLPNTSGPLFGTVQFDNIVVDNLSSAVPEPATWMTMILGFFGLGAMLRRARNRTFPATA